jgi:hypothetical protein
MPYNEKYYHDGSLWQLKPPLRAINTYVTPDGIIIGMFQGNRGEHPDIDFKVRILKPGEDEKPFPPIHTLWVVDLLLKIGQYPDDVRKVVKYYMKFYDIVKPFDSPDSRNNYTPRTVGFIIEHFQYIEQPHTLSLNYVATIVELFCLCEKRNAGAYMFRDLLQVLYDYTNGDADYIEVIRASAPGFR